MVGHSDPEFHSGGQSEIVMDISHLPVGTYIMQIAVGDETTSWKIVKQ
jgi:hypothetical protein